VSATRHWIALDDTFSRLLPSSARRHTRERFAHRAAALSDIYLARILKMIAEPAPDRDHLSCQIDALRVTHRELTATLGGAWTVDRDQGPRRLRLTEDS